MEPAIAKEKRALAKIFTPLILFGGIMVIVLGLIADSMSSKVDKEFVYYYSILIELLKNTGVAIVISSIFTYIIGTNEFIGFIRDKLINIIISKEFIQKLNKEERRDLLRNTLKPSKELSYIYSGIDRYFKKYIDESLDLFNHHYRSGLVVNAMACIDQERKCVAVQSDLSYRVYKVMGEFENLPIGFEDENAKLLFTKVFTPEGQEHLLSDIPAENLNIVEVFGSDLSLRSGNRTAIPANLKEYNQLDVQRSVVEFGQNHWHLFTYRATQPCDKLSMIISCSDELMIKQYITYGKGPSFSIDHRGNKLSVSCNDWLKPGYGIAVVIATKDPI